MRLAEIMGGRWRWIEEPRVFSCLSCPSVWTSRVAVSYGSSKNLKMQIRFSHTHIHTHTCCGNDQPPGVSVCVLLSCSLQDT